MTDSPYGWYGSVSEFLGADEGAWLSSLQAHHLRCMNMAADGGQMAAWRESFRILKQQFPSLISLRPGAADWKVVFEYELPRERGRRPDLVLLATSDILVVEFKEQDAPLEAHEDQVAAYARDFKNYHEGSHEWPLHPILVATKYRGPVLERRGVQFISPDSLHAVIHSVVTDATGSHIDPDRWVSSDYAPLPSLVQAARDIFNKQPLPQIKRALSAGIPYTIASLLAITRAARESEKLHLALVTGVPGAGKTLVGLQFVYQDHFGDSRGSRTAVFLSGNGPLVQVLQYALKSTVFVQDVHGFLKQYGGSRPRVPEEHVWIFDEAQRAWDANRVLEKRGHSASEPADFIQIGTRLSWAVVIGLIGEGQEIHLGEEAGLGQWNEATAASGKPWIVHCPARVAQIFKAAAEVRVDDRLDLTVSLRSHLAEHVQEWVALVLEGRIEEGKEVADGVVAQGFDMYITQDLEAAKTYTKERYAEYKDKTYGLLTSSKARNLLACGIRNDYNETKRLRVGPWYNDPPTSQYSCCQLTS
ncbi:MAG: DUF2075 domain-containing protein, partial [Bacillota bacterium]|nr:DUF2075 domain-containing protein [Bacillota bacterium]